MASFAIFFMASLDNIGHVQCNTSNVTSESFPTAYISHRANFLIDQIPTTWETFLANSFDIILRGYPEAVGID